MTGFHQHVTISEVQHFFPVLWHVRKRPLLFIVLLLLAIFTLGCGPATAVPTAVPTQAISVLNTPAAPANTSTPTLLPSATPTSTPQPTLPPNTPTATNSPTPNAPEPPNPSPTTGPTATAVAINNVPVDQFIIMNRDVQNNIRAIYQLGQELNRDPHAFSKLGDSSILTGHYLTRFDYPPHYDLGDYIFLQPIIDYYKGSFERFGVAARIGLSSWGVLDPLWANEKWCRPNEHMLDCEFRLHNPSILLIRLGTNDATSAEYLESNLSQIVRYTMSQGVIPVLTTKADRFEGEDNRNNEAIRRVAAANQVPLWDFDRIADTLPGRGLASDNVHLSTAAANDFTDPETFSKGYPMNDLSALFLLQTIMEIVSENDVPKELSPTEAIQP